MDFVNASSTLLNKSGEMFGNFFVFPQNDEGDLPYYPAGVSPFLE